MNCSHDFWGGSRGVGVCIWKIKTFVYLYPLLLCLMSVAETEGFWSFSHSVHVGQIPELFRVMDFNQFLTNHSFNTFQFHSYSLNVFVCVYTTWPKNRRNICQNFLKINQLVQYSLIYLQDMIWKNRFIIFFCHFWGLAGFTSSWSWLGRAVLQ